MRFDLLMSETRNIVMVDCELVKHHRRLEAGWVFMAPGNYRPVETLISCEGLEIPVLILEDFRVRLTPSTICHPREPIFFEIDSQFAKEFFK